MEHDNVKVNGKPDVETLHVIAPFVLNAHMAKLYSQSLRVSDEDVREMIQWFIKKKKWTIEFLAAVMDVEIVRLASIRSGRFPANRSERRLIWLYWMIDTHPACLPLPTFHVTWGKIQCIRQEAAPPNQTAEMNLTGYFDPLTVWMNIDWSFGDKQIGNHIGAPRQRVAEVRAFYTSFPFQKLQTYWRRCGKNPAWVAALKRREKWWTDDHQSRVTRKPLAALADWEPSVNKTSSSISV